MHQRIRQVFGTLLISCVLVCPQTSAARMPNSGALVNLGIPTVLASFAALVSTSFYLYQSADQTKVLSDMVPLNTAGQSVLDRHVEHLKTAQTYLYFSLGAQGVAALLDLAQIAAFANGRLSRVLAFRVLPFAASATRLISIGYGALASSAELTACSSASNPCKLTEHDLSAAMAHQKHAKVGVVLWGVSDGLATIGELASAAVAALLPISIALDPDPSATQRLLKATGGA